MRRAKAVPIVWRTGPAGREWLVFSHPLAGTQLVKGSIEPGESASEAALRELAEESGITQARCVRDLGSWEQGPAGAVWHFREVAVDTPLPGRWQHHTDDGGGLVFRFWWWRPADGFDDRWHPVYKAAVAFLQANATGSPG